MEVDAAEMIPPFALPFALPVPAPFPTVDSGTNGATGTGWDTLEDKRDEAPSKPGYNALAGPSEARRGEEYMDQVAKKL